MSVKAVKSSHVTLITVRNGEERRDLFSLKMLTL